MMRRGWPSHWPTCADCGAYTTVRCAVAVLSRPVSMLAALWPRRAAAGILAASLFLTESYGGLVRLEPGRVSKARHSCGGDCGAVATPGLTRGIR